MLTAVKDTAFIKQQSMNVGGTLLNISKPLIMGILNVTTDSFHPGSRYVSPHDYLPKAAQMVDEGAAILDVGAYSTRPGADDIPAHTETERLAEAVALIRKQHPEICISADTFRARTAEKAIASGANIINDVSGGLLDPDIYRVAADKKVPYILMHYRGNPKTMNNLAHYDELMNEICYELSSKINNLRAVGVADIILDPGFGFAKTADQNLELLSRMGELKMFGLPILAGLSRKSTIWRTLNCKPEDALNGTTVLNTLALEKGASILRVHDVREAAEVITLWSKYRENSGKYA